MKETRNRKELTTYYECSAGLLCIGLGGHKGINKNEIKEIDCLKYEYERAM